MIWDPNTREIRIQPDPAEIYRRCKDASVSLGVEIPPSSRAVCSGFFISPDGYIATAGHCALLSDRDDPVGDIYATVTNVNGVTGVNRVYKCSIVGVDGSGDIAVLKAHSESGGPSGITPDLVSQSYLEWGNNQDLTPGDPAYIIGDPLGLDVQSMVRGVVRDGKFTTPDNAMPFECVMVDCSAFGGNSGSPIVNKFCQAIGIFTFVYVVTDDGGGSHGSETFGGGPASHVVEEVTRALIDGSSPDALSVTSGDYLYFNKGFLGLTAWHRVRHFDYADDFGFIGPTGVNIQGIVIETMTTPLSSSGIAVGDWIVTIDGISVGNLDGQCAIGSVTWFKRPGDSVTIEYFDLSSSTPSIPVSTMVTLAAYPAASDVIFSGDTSHPEIAHFKPARLKIFAKK